MGYGRQANVSAGAHNNSPRPAVGDVTTFSRERGQNAHAGPTPGPLSARTLMSERTLQPEPEPELDPEPEPEPAFEPEPEPEPGAPSQAPTPAPEPTH